MNTFIIKRHYSINKGTNKAFGRKYCKCLLINNGIDRVTNENDTIQLFNSIITILEKSSFELDYLLCYHYDDFYTFHHLHLILVSNKRVNLVSLIKELNGLSLMRYIGINNKSYFSLFLYSVYIKKSAIK